jgi:hypothetical protein
MARVRTGAAALAGVALLAGALTSAGSTAQAATTVTFAAAGDFGVNPSTTDYALRSIGAARPAFALALGDLSYDLETPTAWCQRVKNQLNAGAGLPAGSAYGETFPFEVMIGNHDVPTRDEYAACLPDRLGAAGGVTLGPAGYLRQFVVDSPAAAPVVRTIALGTNTLDSYAAGSPGLAWVGATIDDARAKGIRWVVVAVHENYVSVGMNPQQVPASLMDLLLAKKVDLVLQGHDHSYQRTKQLATSATCPTVPTGTTDAACIGGDGAAVGGVGRYTKGRGTVVLVVGTGGRSTYPVSATDPEAGYFATWSGSVYGWARITATETSLSGAFVGTGGIAYSDAWSIDEPAAPPPPPPAPDATAPTAPAGLVATSVTASATARSVALSWTASTDAVGVAGYRVLRGTTVVGTTSVTAASAGTTFTDTTAPAGATSTYTVVALDAAGNASAASRPASVRIPVAATSASFAPSADATVSSGTPTTASGTGTQVSASHVGTPYERSYLKFAVTGLGGRRVTAASLALTGTDASTVGGTLWTTSNAWTESVTWATSPVAGTWQGRYGSVAVGSRVSLGVTSAVPAEGTYSFLLSSSSSDRVRYSSREAATVANRPALVLTLAATDATAPTVPGAPVATATAGQVALTWSAATDDVAVAGYQVERDGVVATTQAGTSWTDPGRAAATTYTYRVRAIDAAGRAGAWTTAVPVTTP